MRISHGSFLEWQKLARVSQRELGQVVGTTNVSYYIRKGMGFPIEWLLAWQEEYKWSDEQLFRYAFGRFK